MYFKEDYKENLVCMLIMLTCLTYKYQKVIAKKRCMDNNIIIKI